LGRLLSKSCLGLLFKEIFGFFDMNSVHTAHIRFRSLGEGDIVHVVGLGEQHKHART